MNFNCSLVSKAIINNDVEAFKELLNKRKRVDIPDNLGYTSLHIAVEKPSINQYIIDTLLNHPDMEINTKTVEGFTSLYVACQPKPPNMETIKKLLVHGADVNLADTEDISPLHIACKRGNLPLVELLVKYNADINSKDFNKYTPLHYAIEYNHKHIVEYLIEKKADADIKNIHGLNALMFAIEERRPFAQLLLNCTKKLNAQTRDKFTALTLAIKQNNVEMVEALIKKRVDLYKFEPLLYALTKNNFEIFKIIWKHIDSSRLEKFEEVFRKILVHCNSIQDFCFLELVINDPDLDSDVRNSPGALAFIFYKGTSLNTQYTDKYFADWEHIYRQFFKCLIQQRIRLSSADLESFIFYFYKCPYRIELLKLLLDNTNADISEYLVIYAFQYDLKLGGVLLQYCVHFYPENLFDHFCFILQIEEDIGKVMKYFLRFFTPNKKNRLMQKLLMGRHMELRDLLDDNEKVGVKSLVELSRDVIRERLRDNCQTTCEFLEFVRKLQVPQDIKDYILLKHGVRNI